MILHHTRQALRVGGVNIQQNDGLKRSLLSIYIVFALVIMGFFGILIFNGLFDQAGVQGATLVVDPAGNGDYMTIKEAVENASDSDTVRVWAGTYYENLEVYSKINLIGNGSSKTIIDGSSSYWPGPLSIYASNVIVSGFKIMNGLWEGLVIGSVNNVTIKDCLIMNNGYGVYIYDSDNVTIENNTIRNNVYVGIYSDYSYSNTFKNNNISFNNAGIVLASTFYHTITNNTMFTNGMHLTGYYVTHWTSHNIDTTNRVNGKPIIYWKNKNSGTVPLGAGQIILANCNNVIVQNQNCSNCSVGIIVGYSDWITIQKNICTKNNGFGIYLELSSNVTMSLNKILYNYNDGISLSESSYNTIINNTCNYNEESGIYFGWDCAYNIIKNNTCNFNNNSGVSLTDYAIANTIIGNNISKNVYGIRLEWDVYFNEVVENTISFNTATGIYVDSWGQSNEIYHNNIISNARQADDQSTSTDWDKHNEGNYWSDYSGVDNGAGGRAKGDGIGDTNIPHPGSQYDNYPFLIPYGWRYPGTPYLLDPGDIDPDGNYTIQWSNNPRALGFILEEDESENFESPTEIFNDTGDSFQISNKPEGTYYYRLKVYNQYYYSSWSEIVNITVDNLPSIPKNFQITVFPEGNTLYISWDINELDTSCYELYYETTGLSHFVLLANLTHPNDTFLHSNLVDNQEYYYKLRTKDKYWQESPFSEVISGTPKDTLAPQTPSGLSAEVLSDTKVELTWDANTDDDLAGYLLYMNDPSTNQVDEFEFVDSISKDITTYTKTGLAEQINYTFKLQAFDEVPNNSSWSLPVWAFTPDETHPNPPTEVTVTNPTSSTLTVSWEHSIDKDVVGYIVYHSKSLSSGYENRTDIITETTFVDTGLDEDTLYYYKIKAIDDFNLQSLESEAGFGKTTLGPKPPSVNNTINDFDIPEDSTDDMSIDLDYLFKDANNDKLTFRCTGQEHIEVTIDQETGMVTLKPEKDWCGTERLTFYANDSKWEISYEIAVSVTNVNDPPGVPEIIKPNNNLKITESDKLDFAGNCTDPDLPYGDVLTYRWKSSIDQQLGVGQELNGILLTPGEHTITLEVSDKAGKKASNTINIDVSKKSKGSDHDEGDPNMLFGVVILVIIIIIVLILVFLFISRRRKVAETGAGLDEGTGTGTGPEPGTSAEGDVTQIPVLEPDQQLTQAQMDVIAQQQLMLQQQYMAMNMNMNMNQNQYQNMYQGQNLPVYPYSYPSQVQMAPVQQAALPRPQQNVVGVDVYDQSQTQEQTLHQPPEALPPATEEEETPQTTLQTTPQTQQTQQNTEQTQSNE